MSKMMLMENYCDYCDAVLHTVCDVEEFYAFKVGAIRCNECGGVHGHIVMPCNECRDENGNHYNCAECPWKNSKVLDTMSDEEYVKYIKKNEPETFKKMLNGDLGEFYKDLAFFASYHK